jgi:hypothetical protein
MVALKRFSSFVLPLIKLIMRRIMPFNPQLSKIYIDLLFKELDVIQDTIKNLDSIIHNSKNFAFLTWGGSLYLITEQLKIEDDRQKGFLLLLAAVIPLLFWAMDYKWRKHILQSSMREKIISLFLNSPEFKKIAAGENDFAAYENFPFYDPVGWFYTKQALKEDTDLPEGYFASKYMLDENKLTVKKVLFYKDAYLFYGTMLLLSIILALVLIF